MSWKGWIALLLVLVAAAVIKPSLRGYVDETGPSAALTDEPDAVPASTLEAAATVEAEQAPSSGAVRPSAIEGGPWAASVRRDGEEAGTCRSSPAATPDREDALESALRGTSEPAEQLAAEKIKTAQLQQSLARTLTEAAGWQGAAKQATAAAIAAFRGRAHDTGDLARRVGTLERSLNDEQAKSANADRAVAAAAAEVARVDTQMAAASEAQHASVSFAKAAAADLEHERDRDAALAGALAKAEARIADLEARTTKPQATIGTAPEPKTMAPALTPSPADGRGADLKADAQMRRPGMEPPRLVHPDPAIARGRQAPSAYGRSAAGARGSSPPQARATDEPREPQHAPDHAAKTPAAAQGTAGTDVTSETDEGAYSMTMDDSRYDFSDQAVGRVSEASVAGSASIAGVAPRPCQAHACTAARGRPIHLARRPVPHRTARLRRF